MGHSKMDDCKLKMQQYLKSNKFNTTQARTIFSFWTRMAKFGENYGRQNGHISCPICFLHLDNQPMAFQCLEVKKEVTVKGKYEDLFDNSITPDVVMTICNIMKIRNKFEQEKYLEMS